ncbi:hypothetical protein AB3N59_12820 [Leptospira sp. WS92.C1]
MKFFVYKNEQTFPNKEIKIAFFPLLIFLILFVSISNYADEPVSGEKDTFLKEVFTRRECDQKLQSCLGNCGVEFPKYRDVRRGHCKDHCVRKAKETEGCLIYYSTSRR